MTAKERVTVSLPADLVESVKRDADGNMSAYVERALRRQQLAIAGEKLHQHRGDTNLLADEDAVALADELR